MNIITALFCIIIFCTTVCDVTEQIVPRVAIITSLYKGDEFIEEFMKDVVQQSVFDQCEFIIINADSPGNEEQIIMPYLEQYPNIIYKRLNYDPGIYGVWNMAIELSSASYITNANIDDRLHSDSIAVHANFLDMHPDIDLVYSESYITTTPNETFATRSSNNVLKRSAFSIDALKKSCLPHNHPMWRRSMHDKHGLFDTIFTIAGDWDMWLRAATSGSQFYKIDGIYGLCYVNPQGLSTNKNGEWKEEFLRVFYAYAKL